MLYNSPANKPQIDNFTSEASNLLERLNNFIAENHHPALRKAIPSMQEFIAALEDASYSCTEEGQAKVISEWEAWKKHRDESL